MCSRQGGVWYGKLKDDSFDPPPKKRFQFFQEKKEVPKQEEVHKEEKVAEDEIRELEEEELREPEEEIREEVLEEDDDKKNEKYKRKYEKYMKKTQKETMKQTTILERVVVAHRQRGNLDMLIYKMYDPLLSKSTTYMNKSLRPNSKKIYPRRIRRKEKYWRAF